MIISRKRWEPALALGCLAALALHFTAPPNIADWPLYLVLAIGGPVFLWKTLAAMIRGVVGVDLLAAIALVAAIVLGQYVAAVLIVLMLAGGRSLEEYAMRHASFALKALAARMPSIAHKREKGWVRDVSVSELRVGDMVEVHPHEVCPVDGTVTEGHGSMDESYLTGEPYHVAKVIGASVLSGALNGETVLAVRAEKVATDTRYAKIIQVMTDAEMRRPALRRLSDQIGGVFGPVALLFALAVWYATGDPLRFLAVLVVATPCPLLIAVPITIIGAISLAASRGIIIKNPLVLERLPLCQTAIFDKTGTLTYGKPSLAEIVPLSGFKMEDILRWTASIEQYSHHPLAQAIITAAKEKKLVVPNAERVSEKPGAGLSGKVGGHEILLTSRKKVLIAYPEQSSLLPPTGHGLEFIAVIDGKMGGVFRLSDAPRHESRPFIRHLGPIHGVKKIMLLSGDRQEEVDYLASLLDVANVLSSQTPEQKLAVVRHETALAPTLFMGDGINDAPALAAATVGIAFGQGGSVPGEAAGAVILDSSLAKVDELMHISIRMRRIALQSAIGGMAFSAVAMGFAAAGYITPVAGALLQEAIDLVAIGNALRLIMQPAVNADIKSLA